MLSRSNNRQRKYLKTFQANVACRQANHDLVLALASTDSVDIFVMRESYLLPNLEKKISKYHPDLKHKARQIRGTLDQGL